MNEDLLERLPEIESSEMARLEARWQAEAEAPRPTAPPGWQRIGSPAPTAGNMPEPRALITMPSPVKPRSSEITGLPSQVETPRKLAGLLRGGIGAFARLNSRRPDESPEERACRLMSSFLNPQNEPSPSDVRCGGEVLEMLWGPASEERDRQVLTLVRTFLNHFPRQRADPEVEPMVLNDWLDDLEEYPLYAVRAALKTLRRTAGEWRPPLSEVLSACRAESREYRKLKTTRFTSLSS